MQCDVFCSLIKDRFEFQDVLVVNLLCENPPASHVQASSSCKCKYPISALLY